MPLRPEYEQAFSFTLKRLECHQDESKRRLASHWCDNLDEGARKILHVYLISLDSKDYFSACFYIAEQYTIKYFDESCLEWVVRNPSAALVATVRRAFFDDYVFAWAYLDVDVTCQASGDKLQ
jgi:hypothetical protein